jgi:glycosyltransferase involved in cell wall biosynthesis
LQKIHFSVVTVVRNDLEGLKKTRKSLEGQKYKNWSHIVIDGDSKDGTNEFLKLLPSENTIYVSEQDNGIYNAMNKGWKLAVPNSFVYFLNARDVFATNISLAKAAESLNQAANTMWGCTTHEEINEDGTGWVCKLVAPPSIPNLCIWL